MQITRHGAPLETIGEPPAVGHTLPDFTLETPTAPVTTAQMRGRYTLISVVPDINTRVCSISTKRFNHDMDAFHDVNFYTVSTNTVAQQQDWCAAEGVTHMQLAADDGNFGRALGLFVPKNGTDARSVWILDDAGTVQYRELITEQTQEPDYDSALAFLETCQKGN